MPNGNKFKGNKGKKGWRKKNPNSIFDEKVDEYAKVISLQGGKHLTIQLLDSKEKHVSALIKGSHHRKIWYKKEELIIVRFLENLYEVQGKVSAEETKTIQRLFDKLDGNDNNDIIFDDNTDINDPNKTINDTNVDDDFNFDDI